MREIYFCETLPLWTFHEDWLRVEFVFWLLFLGDEDALRFLRRIRGRRVNGGEGGVRSRRGEGVRGHGMFRVVHRDTSRSYIRKQERRREDVQGGR